MPALFDKLFGPRQPAWAADAQPYPYPPLDHPVEIAPGRGDLRFSSVPANFLYSDIGISLVGNRTVSFAWLFGTQPYIGAAVMRMLTWAVRVPLKAYRRTGDDSRVRLQPNEHPVARAIVDPWMTGPGPSCQAWLVQSALGPMLVHGNSLVEMESGASDRIQFTPQDWRYALPIFATQNRIAGWDVLEDGERRAQPLSADRTLHLAWWSPLGPTGVSPLAQLGTTLRIEDAAQRYQKSLFERGARPPSAITASTDFLGMDRDEREKLLAQLREDVTDIYAGPDNAGKPALLPPGLDWKQVGHTAVEAALIEQRKVAREEVCAVYMIQPPMLGILDHATFSNIEVQREMTYTDSLAPPLILIEQTINAQLIRGLLGETDVYVEFDFSGVLRGDKLKEINALRLAISGGIMTVNEARTTQNMPKIDEEEADQIFLPKNNLTPLGQKAGE